MNILLITSATKNSNTDIMNKEFIRQSFESGHDVEVLHANTIHHCDGCRACGKIGHCKYKDRLSYIENTPKVIVLSGAVYFFGLNSTLSTALHRLTPVNKIFGLILCSGSSGRMSGVDIIKEQFNRVDEYGDNFTVPIFNKVTHDRRLPLYKKDIKGISKLLKNLEEVESKWQG